MSEKHTNETAHETMDKYETTDVGTSQYETNTDSGDTNQESDPQPAISPAPDSDFGPDNDDSSNPSPIPAATPSSPAQTTETEVDKHGSSNNSAASEAVRRDV